MCRLLFVRSQAEVEIAPHLEAFAEIAQNSEEYQGHGWGISNYSDQGWTHYKNIVPVWQDDLTQFGKSRLFLAHARSAFRDTGIIVENNMPFYDDRLVFIFNGELTGVKIKAEGRIGAEKIFNFIKRFDQGDLGIALERGVSTIARASRQVKAMNIIISDGKKAYVASQFDERPNYFTMHYRTEPELVICSSPYAGERNWKVLLNNSIMVL